MPRLGWMNGDLEAQNAPSGADAFVATSLVTAHMQEFDLCGANGH